MRYGIDASFLIAVELAEHASHASMRSLMATVSANNEGFAIAPQVMAEFIHVSTDERRFERPLTLDEARKVAQQGWTANEVEAVFPDQAAMKQYFVWLNTHRLGRKRQLDTLLAATYFSAGVMTILTLNPRDFAIFGDFHCLTGMEEGGI